MVNITSVPGGRTINEVVGFGSAVETPITLAPVKGTAMQYGQDAVSVIDFPGEYDIHGVTIICYEADETLHFLLSVEGESIALLQNVAILDVATFENVDHWLCMDSALQNEIENLEIGGEIYVHE